MGTTVTSSRQVLKGRIQAAIWRLGFELWSLNERRHISATLRKTPKYRIKFWIKPHSCFQDYVRPTGSGSLVQVLLIIFLHCIGSGGQWSRLGTVLLSTVTSSLFGGVGFVLFCFGFIVLFFRFWGFVCLFVLI